MKKYLIFLLVILFVFFLACGDTEENKDTEDTEEMDEGVNLIYDDEEEDETVDNPGNTNGVTEDKVLVGSFQALSGPVAFIGEPVKKGMEAYFNYVNAGGGVYGRTIDLMVADDQFNPSNTTVEVKRMVESEEVFALVGGLGTPGNLAVMDYVNNNQVPYVYQACGTGLITNPPKKYLFGVQPNYTVEGRLMVKYLVEIKDAKNIAMVYRNLDDGKEEYEAVKDKLDEYGMELLEAMPIDPTATDFSTELVELSGVGADSIIVMLYGAQAPAFIKQAKSLGLTDMNYLLTYANADATFIAASEGQAEGVECMAWVDVDFTDPDLEVFEVYQETYPDELPNAYAIAGMIAAEVFTEGLKRTGEDLTREKYVEAMETFDRYTGIVAEGITYGDYETNPSARYGKQSMYVLKAEGDAFVREHDWIYLND